ncbi:hypothetical protein C4D60_Mb10t26300 [Musa balbisiana]|uniref:GAE domain-containing protein n=1 Tax=Musa balbisiana TaxID=52838 RepID=A0A4S8J2E8_MUSBA|nr:hypothetical protein C4D60_Mb10t26300 [Musa balbisiana]
MSIKDGLMALLGLALYPLNHTTLVELGAMPPLFVLVVKDKQRGVVEDATAMIDQVARCDENVEAFRRVDNVSIPVDLVVGVSRRARVDNVNILVDLVVGGTKRARESTTATLLNLVKSDGDKVVGDVKEVDGAEAAVRALADDNSGFIHLQLDPASSNFLPANSNEEITQFLTVTNTQHGQKALAMRMRIAYKVNNQDKLEQGQVNNFPPGL